MEVIPVPLPDQVKPVPNTRTRTFFIVHECLDEHALKTSLDRLIRHHWRKLGARLVTRREDGLLEYHVPKQFDDDYTLFNWSSRQYDHSIDTVASEIKTPPTDKGPQVLPSMATVDSWFRPADWPYHRADEPPNSPFLFVHLSLFTDATVICISHPHVIADQMGLANIMSAWFGLIEDKEPPPFVGYEGDLLPGSDKKFADYPNKETFKIGRQRLMRRGEYLLVILPIIPELIFSPKEDLCMLFFPLPLVESLRQRHSETLKAKYSDFSKISHGDVLSAILIKLARLNKPAPQMMSLAMAVNLRGLVPQLGPDRQKGFIHNALHTPTARMPVSSSTPVSELAYATRRSVEEAIQPRDIEVGLAVVREMVRRGQSTHTCEPFDRSYHTSNWCAAWRDLDFSAAVKGHAKRPGNKPKLLVLGQSGERGIPQRFSSMIMFRAEEGYWVNFGATKACMAAIKEYFARDPNLENL